MSTLQALHDLLLDQSKWPDDFAWNYDDCESCAIGLAWREGLIDVDRPADAHGYHFGIDHVTAHEIFFTTLDGSYAAVTPEVVAERIANIL
jgi:hypothetical protein